MALTKTERRLRIKRRIRSKLHGTADRPRMSIFRSNKQIYVQFVNDDQGVTVASVSSRHKDLIEKKDLTKIAQAVEVGRLAASVAKSQGIDSVVFDRNGYLYHGRVKALAESAREHGLNF